MPLFFVDLPINSRVVFHSYVNVYQRVVEVLPGAIVCFLLASESI